MSNINIYLCNDTKTINVNIDGKPILLSFRQEVSFNMFLSDVIEFNEKYLHPIKEFTLNIVQNIFFGERENAATNIKQKFHEFETELSSNTFALIVINKIKLDYLHILAKGEEGIERFINLSLSQKEKKLKKIYELDFNAINKLINMIENNFCTTENIKLTLSADNHIFINEGNKRLLKVSIEESLEPLTDAFIYAVLFDNLWLHTCKNCGIKFLSTHNAVYCEAKVCQHQIKLEEWRKKHQNIKNNKAAHEKQKLCTYMAQYIKRLKDRNAPTELVQEMEEWRISIKKKSTYIASYFIDTNTDPDEEYLAFCESTKKSFKARYNEITQSLEK